MTMNMRQQKLPKRIMRYFKDVGFKPQEVYACGGATQSDFWIQMHSDVIGVPIKLTEEHNAPLLGDAILAATGAGLYDSIEEAAEHMVKRLGGSMWAQPTQAGGAALVFSLAANE